MTSLLERTPDASQLALVTMGQSLGWFPCPITSVWVLSGLELTPAPKITPALHLTTFVKLLDLGKLLFLCEEPTQTLAVEPSDSRLVCPQSPAPT